MRPLKDSSDELKEYLEKHMDVDLFVRSMAVDAVVGVWDNYWVNSNNYYFYFDKNHKFYFIPYDYDNTLGTTKPIQNIENAGTQDPLNYGSMGEDRMLVKKVFSIKEYADNYKDYLKELVTSKDLMEPDAAMERMKGFQDLIKDYVENDTGEDMVVEDKSRIGESTIDYKLFSGDDKGGDGSNYLGAQANWSRYMVESSGFSMVYGVSFGYVGGSNDVDDGDEENEESFVGMDLSFKYGWGYAPARDRLLLAIYGLVGAEVKYLFWDSDDRVYAGDRFAFDATLGAEFVFGYRVGSRFWLMGGVEITTDVVGYDFYEVANSMFCFFSGVNIEPHVGIAIAF